MGKLIVFLSLVLIISCGKDESYDPIRGVWVEKTLRLDTILFNSVLSSSHQSVYVTSGQTFTGYNYQIKTDTILLKSFGGSSGFSAYYFRFSSVRQFAISNFFQNPSLPATIQFIRID